MSPTILKVGRYRFFFNSREERRRHVHVSTADGTAKFWLEPEVALASSYNLSEKDVRAIEALVKERQEVFNAAWNRHFTQ